MRLTSEAQYLFGFSSKHFPFVIFSRTTSESNLSSSSSGYSSMASPGPSRSGSSNPLCCLSESEDNTSGTPTKTSALFFNRQHHGLPGLGVSAGKSTKYKYRFPSSFAGVTFQEYPSKIKTADNEGSQFWPFTAFFVIRRFNFMA